MTRALAHLARGELDSSLALHPMAPWIVGEAGLVWLAWGASLVRTSHGVRDGDEEGGETGSSFFRFRRVFGLIAANYALLVLVWVVRLVRGTLPP